MTRVKDLILPKVKKTGEKWIFMTCAHLKESELINQRRRWFAFRADKSFYKNKFRVLKKFLMPTIYFYFSFIDDRIAARTPPPPPPLSGRIRNLSKIFCQSNWNRKRHKAFYSFGVRFPRERRRRDFRFNFLLFFFFFLRRIKRGREQ